MAPSTRGRVYLVGAGPGDPGLITLRGVECLRQADVVLYDGLANPRILDHCRQQAERISLGRHGRSRIVPQQEVHELLITNARAGRAVVHLKGGDPAIFARLAEEVAALRAAGVPFEVVPGITAALASGSYAGIPLTHRDFASAVALVTGHEGDGKEEDTLDFATLASFPGTLVIYMGVTTAGRWSQQLQDGGLPGSTPVALVRHCAQAQQRVVRCRLEEVADVLDQKKTSGRLRPPVIAIVGEVAQVDNQIDWFVSRPLFGRKVVVTRPADQAGQLRDILETLGAEVLLAPVIEITPPTDWGPVDAALMRLNDYDWLVFSSANGVRYFFDRLHHCVQDARSLAGVKLAAVGPSTADELARYQLRADLIPDVHRAEALAEALTQVGGTRYLLARASRGRETLAEELAAAGADVDQIIVYESRDVSAPEEAVAVALESGELDWITVTSSAIARSLARLYGEALHKTQLASISPITSSTLGELGLQPAAEASPYTMQGLCDAILAAESGAQLRDEG